MLFFIRFKIYQLSEQLLPMRFKRFNLNFPIFAFFPFSPKFAFFIHKLFISRLCCLLSCYSRGVYVTLKQTLWTLTRTALKTTLIAVPMNALCKYATYSKASVDEVIISYFGFSPIIPTDLILQVCQSRGPFYP